MTESRKKDLCAMTADVPQTDQPLVTDRPWSLHKQPAIFAGTYGYSIFDDSCAVVVMLDPVPGREGALHDIIRAVNSYDDMRAALQKIERWFGEFPDTGKTWPATQGGGPVSYGAQYGSNGERDFMRKVARDAIALTEGLTSGASIENTASRSPHPDTAALKAREGK